MWLVRKWGKVIKNFFSNFMVFFFLFKYKILLSYLKGYLWKFIVKV